MVRYVRGQVCGVDNCPSRLWKRVNGQNVCQYGHVNQFDIEIDDDDEMMNAAGNGAGGGGGGPEFSRRLVNVAGLTSSQAVRNKVNRLSSDKVETRKYGEDFKKLQARCFQTILAKNTKFVAQQLHLNDEQKKLYVSTVKLIWVRLLDCSLNRQLDTKSKTYDIGHISIINYLAIIQMNIPFYLCDYINLTFDKNFNLERSEYCLPRELRIQIPISQVKAFHGHTLYNYLKRLNGRFALKYINANVKDSNLNYYPLLIRVILDLYLPIEIAKLVKNCVDILGIDFAFNRIVETRIHPELQLMALIIIFADVYFTNNQEKEYNDWYDRFTENSRKSSSRATDGKSFNFIDFKKKIFFDTSFEDLYLWSEPETDEFIDFYETNVLPNISSSNIASNNEYKDRNKLQIVKSTQELFDKELVSEENRSLSPAERQEQQKSVLLKAFSGHQNHRSHRRRHHGHQRPPKDSFLPETLFRHITSMYNCSDFQLIGAIRKVWRQVRSVGDLEPTSLPSQS